MTPFSEPSCEPAVLIFGRDYAKSLKNDSYKELLGLLRVENVGVLALDDLPKVSFWLSGNLPLWKWNFELLANRPSRSFLDFIVPRHAR